jgi:hypothetical protein
MEALVTKVGKVRFEVGAPHPSANQEAFGRAVLQSSAVKQALRGARYRLLHVEAHEVLDGESDRNYVEAMEAVLYDYTHNRTVRVLGPSGGALKVSKLVDQPRPSPQEFQEAVALVAASPVWGALLQSGYVRPYAPMPPNLEPAAGEEVERTVYVGIYSRPRRFNRIVAVNMVRREVWRTEVVPRNSRALGALCGPNVMPCQRPPRGTAGSANLSWPEQDPVWSLQVIRPSASSGTNGSGVEVRNVRYKGQSVLRQGHVPVLNVQYDLNLCGPYRDWLYEETCFDAVGTDVPGTQGIRWCDAPPQTVFEKNQDGGNFVGVAIFEHEDGSLRLLCQNSAGWYRYVIEWGFYLDGTIIPRFRFGAVADSCTCNPHNHHAYWRLDWEILNAKNSAEELINGIWTPLRKEVSRVREIGEDLRWRVKASKADQGYEVIPGENDNVGDAFSGPDQMVVRKRNNEIDDGQHLTGSAQTTIHSFAKKAQSIVKKDLVMWYTAHFRHEQPEEDSLHDNHNVAFGPTLQPFGDW